jgi:hypothetical protein
MTRAVAPTMMLADLDEVLRGLLECEFEAAGLTGVTITFDAPSRDRTAQWASPAIDLFLYDLQEAPGVRDRSWQQAPDNGGAVLVRAPLRLACTYAITAWTQSVLDEHRLLSQVVAILGGYPQLPVDLLPASLLVGDPPSPLSAELAHERDEARAEFWTAIGGQYKVSLDYTVTVLCDPKVSVPRGPPVKTEVVTAGGLGAGAGGLESRYSTGGVVRDEQGRSLEEVAVTVPALGLACVTGPDGSFVLRSVPAGTHSVQARGAGGQLASGELTVPGDGVVLTLDVGS